MTKVSLADLRSGERKVQRSERSYDLCIRRDLLARVDELTNQVVNAPQRDESAPPARKGQADPLTKIRKELEQVYAEMDENTGTLRLRAVPDGEWLAWTAEHPAREGNQRDKDVAFGICNSDDLAVDLGRWVSLWNDEPLSGREWDDLLAPNAAGGDLKNLVALVVSMQEDTTDPKLMRRVLLGSRPSSAADSSPEQ